MRNGIHTALTIHTGQSDWYDRITLIKRERDRVSKAKNTISSAGKTVIPGRVVAGLMFDFWTSLLSTGAGPAAYGPTIWSPNNAALIRQAFPLLQAPNQNRGYAHRQFNSIRTLRNRVSHHEPIWRGVTLQSGLSVNLSDLYTDIIDAIGWVSPDLQASVVAFDRFPHTLQNGQAMVEIDIKHHLGIT